MEKSPATAWALRIPWEYNESEISKQFGEMNGHIKQLLDTGQEIETDTDEAVLTGRWVLLWYRDRNGGPSKRTKPWWIKIGYTVINQAYRHAGETKWRNCILGCEAPGPEPFDATDERFISAFRSVILRPEYQSLRSTNYANGWYSTYENKFAEIWREVKKVY